MAGGITLLRLSLDSLSHFTFCCVYIYICVFASWLHDRRIEHQHESWWGEWRRGGRKPPATHRNKNNKPLHHFYFNFIFICSYTQLPPTYLCIYFKGKRWPTVNRCRRFPQKIYYKTETFSRSSLLFPNFRPTVFYMCSLNVEWHSSRTTTTTTTVNSNFCFFLL